VSVRAGGVRPWLVNLSGVPVPPKPALAICTARNFLVYCLFPGLPGDFFPPRPGNDVAEVSNIRKCCPRMLGFFRVSSCNGPQTHSRRVITLEIGQHKDSGQAGGARATAQVTFENPDHLLREFRENFASVVSISTGHVRPGARSMCSVIRLPSEPRCHKNISVTAHSVPRLRTCDRADELDANRSSQTPGHRRHANFWPDRFKCRYRARSPAKSGHKGVAG